MEFGGGGEHCRRLRLRTGFKWHLVVRGQPFLVLLHTQRGGKSQARPPSHPPPLGFRQRKEVT